jgi:hypothetical protein
VPRADKAPRLHTDLNRVAAPPRTHHTVPDFIFERLEKKREKGTPHVWKDKHVKAIVKHVSKKTVSNPRAPLGINFDKVDQELAATEACLNDLRAQKQAADLACARLPPQPTLEQRLAEVARPSTSASSSWIIPQGELPDFKKLADKDLRSIYSTRLEAFRKRLTILFEIGVGNETRDAKDFHRLYVQLNNVLRSLKDKPTGYQPASWLQIHYFCQRSVLIEFKQIRKNLEKVLHHIGELYRAKYLAVSQV